MSAPAATTTYRAQSLTRDPISLILPFLALNEFVTSAALISREWYSAAQTIRSRHESLVMVYTTKRKINPAGDVFGSTTSTSTESANTAVTNSQQLAASEVSTPWFALHTSSLRHHITHLEAKLTVDNEEATQEEEVPKAFTKQLNAIAESMPHLDSLRVKSFMYVGTLDQHDKISSHPQFPLYPPHLRSLKFEFDQLPPKWWIQRLFEGITSTPTLCASLTILESTITGSDDVAMHPAEIVTTLHKLTSLRRLMFRGHTSMALDNDAIDAVRAIPSLCEFAGCQQGRDINHLLASDFLHPSRHLHAFCRIGESMFGPQQDRSLIHVSVDNGPGVHTPIDIDLLLVSSSSSLTELHLRTTVIPTFLPRFTQLRVLRIQIDDPWPGQGQTLSFTTDDTIDAIAQCLQLEWLYYDGFKYQGVLNESQAECMLKPLLHLEFLVFTARCAQFNSLEFLNRLHHFHSNLRYLAFSSYQITADQVMEYHRPLYSLTQLRLLHIMLYENVRSEAKLSTLDEMFRPGHQVISSYPDAYDANRFGGRVYANRGPGTAPAELLPHLQQFMQSVNVDEEPEWQKIVDQVELEREKELLQVAKEV